jgi:hypothetical protein
MLFTGYEPTYTEMKPKLSIACRNQLEEAGLIQTESRKKPNGKKANFLVLTDHAWDWAVQNLDAKVSDRSYLTGPVLHDVLTHLKRFMQTHDVSLYEFLKSAETSEEAAAPLGQAPVVDQLAPARDLEARIREAYLSLSNGQLRVRVRLAALRDRLASIPREQLDETLKRMKQEERAILFPLENPMEIRPEDEQAAISIAGRSNHILILEG